MSLKIVAAGNVTVDLPEVIESKAPGSQFAAVFEDGGETGSFNALGPSVAEQQIQDTLHKVGRAVALLFCLGAMTSAIASDCSSIDNEARARGVRIPESNAGYVTTGIGRVQFYSAPGEDCHEKGVFVLPGEELFAYMTFGDFTSVMYINPKNGADSTGWVKSSRLKEAGFGIGPN